MAKILAADIGGTNSRFAFFECGRGQALELKTSRWLATREASSFEELLRQLWNTDFPLRAAQVDLALMAVAGPVEAGRHSAPPYIPWEIDTDVLLGVFGLKRATLVNDFVAQAFACRSAMMTTARRILPGEIEPDAPLVVVGAGTGLGQAVLLPDGRGRWVALPSEGGHASFPFETAAECSYQRFLEAREDDPYVHGNMVVSGKGLTLLHRFLTGEELDPAEVGKRLSADCETLRWMSRFYARVCRNAALQAIARGGVYIAGGVAAKLPQLVTHAAFAEEFRRSGTMRRILEKIPVFLNTNEESGLWGAALAGAQRLGFECSDDGEPF